MPGAVAARATVRGCWQMTSVPASRQNHSLVQAVSYTAALRAVGCTAVSGDGTAWQPVVVVVVAVPVEDLSVWQEEWLRLKVRLFLNQKQTIICRV